ncbi:MAG TPA: polymer-forming cytoskeletal protein, partial [Bryobacteraceae bacterium]|nr:polymer-forming cytoskeletal protein [Bryobacteraceae bacterium]
EMWNRRKEEEKPAPRPVAAPPPTQPARPQPAKEGIPMSTVPSRPTESFDAPRAGNAVLGKSVIVKGQILSREDLTIDGEVEGTIEMQEHRLTVGPNGKVRASVKAREVIVLGTLHGNVETGDRIDIRKEAKLVGDIRTARIVIEDGAYFKGNVDIVRADVPRPAAATPAATTSAPRPQASPTSSPAASPAISPAAAGPAMAAGAGEIKR